MVSFFPRNAVLPQCDLGTNKQRHVCKLRPSISHPVGTGCLAHYPKKSNRMNARHKQACGWTHKHKTQSNSFSFQQSYTSTLCSSVPKAVTHRNGTATLLRRASQSHYVGSHFTVLCCLSFSEPCIITTPSFLFDFSFPHSCLACVPRQMVHASRCSPPSPCEGKTKPGCKANKICLRVPMR